MLLPVLSITFPVFIKEHLAAHNVLIISSTYFTARQIPNIFCDKCGAAAHRVFVARLYLFSHTYSNTSKITLLKSKVYFKRFSAEG